MRKIKVITQSNPIFLKTVYKHDDLVDLQNDDRWLKRNERFITYADATWYVRRKDAEGYPRLCGSFTTFLSAIYCARLK
jgi:hypothetical protein